MLLLDVTVVRLLFFVGKSKKSAWATWVSYPDATETFLHFATDPYEPIDCTSPHFSVLERFTVILYHKESTLLTVKKNKSLENLPPAQDALLQHTRRAIYQSSIWNTGQHSIQNVSTPEGWGWTKDDNTWKPVWIIIPEAARACSELIRCRSKRGCSSYTANAQNQV